MGKTREQNKEKESHILQSKTLQNMAFCRLTEDNISVLEVSFTGSF